jgi:hypothetical protein
VLGGKQRRNHTPRTEVSALRTSQFTALPRRSRTSNSYNCSSSAALVYGAKFNWAHDLTETNLRKANRQLCSTVPGNGTERSWEQ